MIEIEILRKKILDSLKTERKQFLISNKSNTDEKKNKNTHNHVRNIDLNNLYTLEKSELIFLSIDYTKKGKIKKALEVALEIDDAEYLWLEHYDNMISETISYCDKKNDYNILDKLSLIAIQFSALQDYLEYGKSADEIEGVEKEGIPSGIMPTTATPSSLRPNSLTTSIPTTTTIKAAGIFILSLYLAIITINMIALRPIKTVIK